ncbi:uncharacterized protein [Epargyreus clarus]|uniref:uncharacterized protein n=1 Tax=Epargyreus clarus TaxID=520877 RepID=UPI003C2C278B
MANRGHWAPIKRGRNCYRKHKIQRQFNFATWNIRTLLDNPSNLCPERKTALIARELSRYNIDIAALNETHLAESGELCEGGGGYTYYWIGKPSTVRASSGVGFAIKTKLAQSLLETPKGINDRLMTLRLHISDNKYLHLISVYAPTMTYSDEEKLQFYDDLRIILRGIPPSDKVLLMGDFNARVGSDHQAWQQVLGRHGVGKCNTNGSLLLSLCAEFNLSVTNTFFRMPDKFKTSWMHPRSKHWHLIDYVIVRRADLKDVLVTRAMRGAEGWTDHRLIRSKVRLCYKPPHRASHKVPIRLAYAKLTNDAKLQEQFNTSFEPISYDQSSTVDDNWRLLAKSLRDAAQRVIGKPGKKNQDWFDDSDAVILKLVNDYRRTLQSSTSDAHRRSAQRELKARVRELKDRWWLEKAQELQHLADTKRIGLFFESLRTIFGPRYKLTSPIYSRDKTKRLTEHGEILSRWAEHFCDVLNPASHNVDLAYVNSLQTLPISYELDDPLSFDEFLHAVNQLKNGKTAGSDNLPGEIYKYGGPKVHTSLFQFILHIWESGVIPQDWKDATICKIFKGKGSISDCEAYRGIVLLNAADWDG